MPVLVGGALLFAAKDAKLCSLASCAYIGSSVLSPWLLTTASLGSFMNKCRNFSWEIAPGFLAAARLPQATSMLILMKFFEVEIRAT